MKTITKNNFLKLAMTIVAVLVFTGATGQVAVSDYVPFDPDAAAPNNFDYVTLKAGGTTLGYYAKPDAIYHPGYVDATWTLTAGFVWNWRSISDPGSVPTFNKSGAANYVEITYPDLGDYSIGVKEQASAAFGECESGIESLLNVRVISPPTGTISINPAGSWQEVSPNQSYQICSDQLGQTVTISFNENIPNGLAAYAFQITKTIERLDGNGLVISTPTAETAIQNFAETSKLKDGNVGGLTDALFVRATPAFTFTFTTEALNVISVADIAARTRYTYKVARTGDPAQNGFYSAISHKSDYLGAISYYDFTAQTVSFIVNPAPATGPIYHIPNSFNL
jgi:hypothetical protein